MVRRFLSVVSAVLWVSVGVAAFATLSDPRTLGSADPGFAVWVAVLALPPIAVGVGCLFLRGFGMVVVAAIGAAVSVIHLLLLLLGSGSPTEQIWGYLVLAAVGVFLVWGVWAWIDQLRHPERIPPPPDPVANLDAAHAAGTVTDAIYPFELARVYLAQTGNRRLFVCGRCGKPISLAWNKCDHCQATFDEFPPIATGEEIKAQPDVVDWATRF